MKKLVEIPCFGLKIAQNSYLNFPVFFYDFGFLHKELSPVRAL